MIEGLTNQNTGTITFGNGSANMKQPIACEVKGQIPGHYDSLRQQIMQISEEVQILTDQLNPVLRPISPQVQPNNAEALPPSCPLVEQLIEDTQRLNNIYSRIADLRNRIEL